MPAHTRKHLTNEIAHFTWRGSSYDVPVRIIEKYKSDDNKSIDDVFADIIDEAGEPAALLKGLRYREGLTQVAFAKIIGVSQANLSSMENGRRMIGKDIAKRIEKKFKVNYRLFL